ncbi:MAG: DNA alkylation response protein, partial [Microbacterium sp.]|nr:DNA alkylation response protein [Microbacterium sp.]
MTTMGRGRQPGGTHIVDNQPPWRVDVDEYTLNGPLGAAVARFGGGWADAELRDIGRLVGGEGFQRDASLAHPHPPVAHTFDRWGFRLDEVEYDSTYHRVIGAAVAHGAHTAAWADPRPGAAVARAATFMLFAQVEPGH